ncbi:MAG: DegT/DnrJ/EryC1/StrS family aminotransferase [Candidatus Omnitrophica bacterium]|nr:DegT/DnrJ/EryC1/StrS family aminotransferase [Candidatus Omnitrophota bacterium]
MSVFFLDIGAQHTKLKKEITSAINRVIKKGDFILGDELSNFEKEFAAFCKVKYAVGVSSGTAALFLALKALDIKEGDEVILPVFTFIATALAVTYTGAKPVFMDIDEKTYNLDVKKVRGAINKNTKAIIPVHLYGHPADMNGISRIAREYHLRVVEDAAQAHGATINMHGKDWVPVGGLSDAGCFSFYPTKNLGGMGDGGIITTNSEEIYKKLLMLRDYGRVSRYEHIIVGYNSRLDTLQAAVLRVKLKRLEEWNRLRQKAASIYSRLLPDKEVILPFVQSWARHVYHTYAIRVKAREGVLRKLKERKIGFMIYYPIPLHLQKVYQELGYKKGDFPVAEKISEEILSIPLYPYIKENQLKKVAEAIREGLTTE